MKCITVLLLVSFALNSVMGAQSALSGTVSKYDGTPAGGLLVVLENNGIPEAEATTDVLGVFALSINSGLYTQLRVRNISVDLAGLPSTVEHTVATDVNILADTSIDITLPRYVHLTGKVMDSDGNVLTDELNLIAKKWESGAESTPWDNCNVNGGEDYSLYQEPGDIKIWIDLKDGSQITRQYTISSDTVMNIVLSSKIAVSGFVSTPVGDLVRGITVTAELGINQYETLTDDSGFYFLQLDAGIYRLRLRNGSSGIPGIPGTVEETVIETITLSTDTTINIQTPFYPAVRCSVVDSKGSPVGGVNLTIKKWDGYESTPWDVASTDSTGCVTLYCAQGNNKIWVDTKEQADLVAMTLELAVTTDTSVTIAMSEGTTLSGYVYTHAQVPIQGLNVTLEKDADQWMTTSDINGYYNIVMQDGTYSLRVRNMSIPLNGIPSTLEYTVTDTITLLGAVTRNIILPNFPTVSGVISDAGGNAISGATVTGKRWIQGAESTPWDQSESGADGSYSLTLGEGTNKIWVQPPKDDPNLGDLNFIDIFETDITRDIIIPDLAKGITRFQPSVITQGKTGEVMINGIGVDFMSGDVNIDLGQGITITNIRAMSAISILADISISDVASKGTRDVVVTVGSTSIAGPSLLTITAPAEKEVILDANNETIEEMIIGDGTGTELLIPAGTEILFPSGSEMSISYEAPILQADDPSLAGVEMTTVQRELGPAGLIFKDTVYMTVQYSDQDVEGIDETGLRPYFYTDDQTGMGTGVLGDAISVTAQDTSTNSITFSIPHFSMFRLASGVISSSIRFKPKPSVNQFTTGMLIVKNSFSLPVNISFSVGKNDAGKNVQIDIYNGKGQLIRKLMNKKLTDGTHNVLWDGGSEKHGKIGSGNYIVCLIIDNKSFFKSVVVLKKYISQ